MTRVQVVISVNRLARSPLPLAPRAFPRHHTQLSISTSAPTSSPSLPPSPSLSTLKVARRLRHNIDSNTHLPAQIYSASNCSRLVGRTTSRIRLIRAVQMTCAAAPFHTLQIARHHRNRNQLRLRRTLVTSIRHSLGGMGVRRRIQRRHVCGRGGAARSRV
jgi:hypothetical protein